MNAPNSASLYLPFNTLTTMQSRTQCDHDDDGDRALDAALHVVHLERCQPDGGESEATHGEADHLDRDAALVRPVHVLQVEDERELVEHERRPDADEQRADDRPRRPVALVPTAMNAPATSRMMPGTA